MQRLAYILFHRIVLVAIALLLQVAVLVVMIMIFSEHLPLFYWWCILLSIVVTLWIINRPGEPAYKIGWLILIFSFPVLGGSLYLLAGGIRLSDRTRKKMNNINKQFVQNLYHDYKSDDLLPLGEDAAGQARYLENHAFCPAYTNTEAEYFPLGDLAFTRMLEQLRCAKRYIFLEYFIIQPGKMWDHILEVLKEKAAEGLDVRVIYDDMGSIFALPKNYDKKLSESGIQCRSFNRFIPVVSLRLNNRDHRKLMIIDGGVGFTGGINLADEYINAVEKYGHWKDSVIMLEGDAVWSMTVMFLTMWDYCSGWEENLSGFRPRPFPAKPWTGYVQPYTDTPLDDETVSQTVYLNMISRARKFIYITTPYLIIDTATNTALCNAAKAGVDVRIITPHIPDKKIVFEATKAHYPPLLEAGVKIYEYTPGFIHAKNFVVDGKYATVGTVNLDYRSLFLHFENGVWLCEAPCIADIIQDFQETIEKSQAVSLRHYRRLNPLIQLYRSVLRVFAPMM